MRASEHTPLAQFKLVVSLACALSFIKALITLLHLRRTVRVVLDIRLVLA
jgi:hypothetical protein